MVYTAIFYLQFHQRLCLDFSSFYTSLTALDQGINPYQNFSASYLHMVKKLPANLNPPIFLVLLKPLYALGYDEALPIWALLSFVLGLAGAIIIAILTYSKAFLRKHAALLLFIYLSLFSTIMNTVIAQMGAILLFFIMAGYLCFRHQQNGLAGFFWGFISSIKLFPALLFFYAFKQKRYRVCMAMLTTFIILWIIPLCTHGPALYDHYFKMMSRVLWYGDSWNASLFGFLFRLGINPDDHHQSLLFIKITYFLLFCALLAWYWRKMDDIPPSNPHYAFCLTLLMMLLLSPFGWLYYFSLLLFPLALTWERMASNASIKAPLIILWFISFFIINLPLDYVMATNMTSLLSKSGLFSIYFYGLLLLTFILCYQQTLPVQPGASRRKMMVLPLMGMVIFSLFIPLTYFIFQLRAV